ncbi:MAG: hypothetical protein ACXWJW_07300 [Xanthobacteraceae bacterium]
MSSPKTARKTPKSVRAAKPAKKALPKSSKVLVTVASRSDTTAQAKKLAADIERALSDGRINELAPEALQDLMAAVCKTYSAQIEAGNEILPLRGRTTVTSTDIMTTASGLLKAANLAVFELGMWQSWTGR